MKEQFKIESGIPIPTGRNGKSRGFAEVLRRMKRGDSVLFPITPIQAGNAAKMTLGKGNYACRADGKGTRVWRIK